MPGNTCFYISCLKRQINYPHLTMFKFPTDDRLEKWIINSGDIAVVYFATAKEMCENQEKPSVISYVVDRYSRSEDNPINKIVLQPYYYLESNPGKGIREKMAGVWNTWLKISDEKLATVLDIPQIIQNGSLLIDDIEDSSTIRRGKPVAHNIYGVGSTICSSMYAVLHGLRLTMDFIKPEEIGNIIELGLQSARGQGMELYWREHNVCPTIAEYKEMVMGKTGMFFKLIEALMQMHSTEKINLARLSEIIGMAFQVIDDYKNLTSEEYMKTKSFCEDITEGKFSLPILYAIHSHPEDKQILDILRQRTTNREDKLRCLSLIEKYGGFDYTKKVISELRKEAMQEIQKLASNPSMEMIIDAIFTDTADIA